jgi:hypothetical protein
MAGGLHLYAQGGGHDFGMHWMRLPPDTRIERCCDWPGARGLLMPGDASRKATASRCS